jgi:hypothetical protein
MALCTGINAAAGRNPGRAAMSNMPPPNPNTPATVDVVSVISISISIVGSSVIKWQYSVFRLQVER